MKNWRRGGVVVGGVTIGAVAALVLMIPGCGGSSNGASSGASGSAGAGGAGGTGTGTAGAAGVPLSGGTSGNGGAPSQAGASGSAGSAEMGGVSSNAGSAGFGGSVGHAGSSGQGGTAGSSSSNGLLGSSCAVNLDCGPGLECVLPNAVTLPNGGPANGLCTRTCTVNSECDAVSPGAGCVNFTDANYCLEACTQGEPVDISAKCQGRPDMACSAFTSSAGSVFLCTPLCRTDGECGAGTFCDPGSGLCVKTKPSGAPVGTPCDPTAVNDACLGSCLTTSAAGVTPATGVCVQICSGLTECKYTGTQPGGICVGALSANFGTLDLGYCEPGCNCTAECAIPGDVCQAWGSADAAYQADLGSAGFCYLNAIGSTELTACAP